MRRTTFDHTPDGLARRIHDLERGLADEQRMRNAPPTYVEPEEGVSLAAIRARATSFTDATTALTSPSTVKYLSWTDPSSYGAWPGQPYYVTGGAAGSGQYITPGAVGLWVLSFRIQVSVAATATPLDLDDWASVTASVAGFYNSGRIFNLGGDTKEFFARSRVYNLTYADVVPVYDVADDFAVNVLWDARGDANVSQVNLSDARFEMTRVSATAPTVPGA